MYNVSKELQPLDDKLKYYADENTMFISVNHLTGSEKYYKIINEVLTEVDRNGNIKHKTND